MANNFITNAQQRSLRGRIHRLIEHSQELKFLVGFFYFSGWSSFMSFFKARSIETKNPGRARCRLTLR